MARSVDCSVILKYCEIIDEFIRVRVFTEEDIGELLQVKNVPNKSAYQQLVVNACIVNFHDEVLPRFKKLNRVYKSSALEELLYQICVEVNPHLEIHQVSLPIDDPGGDSGQLHLLQPGRARNQRQSRQNLARIEQSLHRSIIGQEAGIQHIMKAIRKAAAGLRDPRRPLGAFLLIGRTGTGKAELAKTVARTVFGDLTHLVRVDCSEYALPHEYAKLIGAPPGYVGHNEGGQLTEALKEKKAGVVLFDEIEKAHRKVHNLLLQVMDEGFLTDNKGTIVSFNRSLILLTSNVGIEELDTIRNRMGFDWKSRQYLRPEESKEATLEAMKNNFPPEFINRLDDVVVFNTLTEHDCVKIARNQIEQLRSYLLNSGIDMHATQNVCRRIARLGFNPDYGARELRRILQNVIEDPLSDMILAGQFTEGDHIRVSIRGDRFTFDTAGRRRRRRTGRPTSAIPREAPSEGPALS